MAAVTNNAVAKAGMGLGPTTTIVVTDAAVANDAAAQAIVDAMGAAGHTIAGVSGTANNAGVMHFALQGGPDASAYSAEVLGQAVSAVVTFTSNP
jgi:hypothetical protein